METKGNDYSLQDMIKVRSQDYHCNPREGLEHKSLRKKSWKIVDLKTFRATIKIIYMKRGAKCPKSLFIVSGGYSAHCDYVRLHLLHNICMGRLYTGQFRRDNTTESIFSTCCTGSDHATSSGRRLNQYNKDDFLIK